MRVVLVLLLTVGLGACLAVSPEEAAAIALGDTDHHLGGEPSELHRPGQPCLVCHGRGYHPGEVIFDVAGTVYATPDASRGLAGARVTLTDGEGREVSTRTNRSGNFMFVEGGGGDDDEGTRIPFRLAWPLLVRVTHGDVVREMESPIWREGSCAHCHARDAGEASVGRVVLEGTP